MFGRLRIATKLFLVLGCVVLAMVVVAAYGMVSLKQAQAATVATVKLSADLVDAVDSARAAEVSFKIQVQEFKNVLLRGRERSDYDKYYASFHQRSERVAKELGEVEAVMRRVGIPTTPVEEARRMHAEITRAYEAALKGFDAALWDSAQTVDGQVRGKDRPMEEKIEAIVASVERFAQAEHARAADAAEREAKAGLVFFAGLSFAAAAVALTVGLLIIRGLLRELGGEPDYAKEVAERIAAGDLSVQVEVRAGDRASVLASMRAMADNLRELVRGVSDGARTVADTSSQIAQGNTDLSQRTEEQASTLEETASQMEELTSTVTQNAENARQANALAVGASDVARRGGEVVGDVVRTMSGISESARRIADIIGVIDGIAFQTNILALNAAVEAARAGEQGRGFAVVAAEVRNLAQRSASAAKEIKVLIGDSLGKVEAGTKLVDQAGRTMGDIVGSVNNVSQLIAEIAAASEEQSSGIEQVNTAITQLDGVVQQNASLVEEAAAATGSMTQQAARLLEAISRFRLDAAAAALAPVHVLRTAGPAAARAPVLPVQSPAPIRFRTARATSPHHVTAAAKRQADGEGSWKEF